MSKTNPKNGKRFLWNGMPVESVKFGYVIQEPNKEKPMYWYNCEVARQKGQGITPCIIPAVEIVANGQKEPFAIANFAGVGVHKMEEGGGMFTAPHFSLDGEFTEDENFAVYDYNENELTLYRLALDMWQQQNFPDDWAEMQQFKQRFQPNPKPSCAPLQESNLYDCNGNPIKRNAQSGVSGATSLHLKHRNGKKR